MRARSTARSSRAASRRRELEEVGKAGKGETGTTISFLPDSDVFEELDLSAQTLAQRFRETAFLTKGLRIVFVDEREGEETQEFYAEGGIRDFVAFVNETKDAVHRHIVYFEGENEQGTVEVAMQWNTSYVESVFSFANNINTHEGGTHLSGFKAALTGTLNRYARDKGLLKEKEDNLDGEDVREGLGAVISIKLRDPQFEGQTKTKLGNPWVRGPRRADGQREARRVPRGEPDRRAPDRPEGDLGCARAPGGAQGAGADAPQERARELVAPGQARRLHDPQPGGRRALHRRGRLGRRLGQDGPRPHLPGDPPAARQDHQQREEPHQQGALEQRDPGDDHRDRDRDRRRVRHRQAALPPQSSS